MRSKIFIILIIILLISSILFAQDSTQFSPSGIKVLASVSTKEIPLNRLLKFTIQVEWFGDLNRYQISEVENPIVKNFQIKSNASSDRRELVDSQLKAIKTFEFDLIPQELGMGYIEGLIVKYIDTETGEGKHLITNRLDVKVIDPIPELGSKMWLIKLIIFGVIGIGLIVSIFFWLQKKAEERKRKLEQVSTVQLEEEYLQDLKNSISLESADIDLKSGYSLISLILRKYLDTKYNFDATKITTQEIIAILKENDVSESFIEKTEEILNKCDIAKFSGGTGEKSELERIYTLVEDVLNSNLKQTVS